MKVEVIKTTEAGIFTLNNNPIGVALIVETEKEDDVIVVYKPDLIASISERIDGCKDKYKFTHLVCSRSRQKFSADPGYVFVKKDEILDIKIVNKIPSPIAMDYVLEKAASSGSWSFGHPSGAELNWYIIREGETCLH